jgi:hypothetical protein
MVDFPYDDDELLDDDLPDELEDFPSDEDALRAFEERHREARRAVEEAGGGEAEGFELAEEELIEHTSHADQHSTAPIMRDAAFDDAPAEGDELYGEADEEHKGD